MKALIASALIGMMTPIVVMAETCEIIDKKTASKISFYGSFQEGDSLVDVLCRLQNLDQEISVTYYIEHQPWFEGKIGGGQPERSREEWSAELRKAITSKVDQSGFERDWSKRTEQAIDYAADYSDKLEGMGLHPGHPAASKILFLKDTRLKAEPINIAGLDSVFNFHFTPNPIALTGATPLYPGPDFSYPIKLQWGYCVSRTYPECQQKPANVELNIAQQVYRMDVGNRTPASFPQQMKIVNAVADRYGDDPNVELQSGSFTPNTGSQKVKVKLTDGVVELRVGADNERGYVNYITVPEDGWGAPMNAYVLNRKVFDMFKKSVAEAEAKKNKSTEGLSDF